MKYPVETFNFGFLNQLHNRKKVWKNLFWNNSLQPCSHIRKFSLILLLQKTGRYCLALCQWITDIMGCKPIQPIIQPITINTILNWITDRYFLSKNIGLNFVMGERSLMVLCMCNGCNCFAWIPNIAFGKDFKTPNACLFCSCQSYQFYIEW